MLGLSKEIAECSLLNTSINARLFTGSFQSGQSLGFKLAP